MALSDLDFLKRLLSGGVALPAAPRAEAPPPNVVEQVVARLDGWVNPATGLGTTRDKRQAGFFLFEPLTLQQCRELYRGSGIAARAVDLLPDEMVREGFEVRVPDDADAARYTATRHQELGTLGAIHQALVRARVEGGAALYLGVDDGRAPSTPLDWGRVRRLTHLTVLESDELLAESHYAEPLQKGYGEVALWRLHARMPGSYLAAGGELVHASRVVHFPGVRVGRLEAVQNYGHGDSIYNRLGAALRDWESAHDGSAALLQDASQGVFKQKGLAQLLQAGKGALMRQRFLEMDYWRSMLRAIVIDSEEDFSRVATSFGGVAETLDRHSLRVSGILGYPVTLLFGQAPAGLQATGEADLENFRNKASAAQVKEAQPAVETITRLLLLEREGPTRGREPESWEVWWRPLVKLGRKEEAEVRKLVADTDAVYMDKGVTSAAEVGVSRFGGGQWSAETTIDLEIRAELEAPDPAPSPEMPGAPASPPGEAPLATTALNGGQVGAAQALVMAVVRRELPRETGVAMLRAFFQLSPADAETIMGPAGRTFFADAPAPAGAGGLESLAPEEPPSTPSLPGEAAE